MPLQIIRQDITKMKVDAIVNTTNASMIGYDGVDLAVHTIAGPKLDEECAKLIPLELGQAKATKGYDLSCKYVIHTAGPVWNGGLSGEIDTLRSCYVESLNLAVEKGCRSVAFPLIGTGAYRFPKDIVLKLAVQTITEFLFEHELMTYICVFDKESYSFSQKLFSEIQEFIDDAYADDRENTICDRYDTFDAPRMASSTRRPRISDTRAMAAVPYESSVSLDDFMKQMDRSFQELLFDLIDESGMSDVECYKKANVDKRTFSKIKSNINYQPSKQTAIAFAISLQLDMDATQELLATAGFTLSNSKVFDKIITYFILNKRYDIFEINEALFEFDQQLLGV